MVASSTVLLACLRGRIRKALFASTNAAKPSAAALKDTFAADLVTQIQATRLRNAWLGGKMEASDSFKI